MALLSKIIDTVARKNSAAQDSENSIPAKTMRELLAEEGISPRGVVRPASAAQPIKIPASLASETRQPKPERKLDYQSMSLSDMLNQMGVSHDMAVQGVSVADKSTDAIGKCPWDTVGKNHSAVPAAHNKGQQATIDAILNNRPGIGMSLSLMEGVRHNQADHVQKRRFQ